MPKCAGCDAGVIEDIARESLTTEVTLHFRKFSQQESKHSYNFFPQSAARCSLESLSADRRMPT
jgi:hypothetical protein